MRSRTSDVVCRLEKFSVLLSSLFGVELSLPLLDDNVRIKEFLSGLLEGKPHPWDEPLKGLSQRHRYSVAFSLFLFRKLLPSSKPGVDDYVRKMVSEQDPPDLKFLDFCRQMVRRLFPVGWDRSYVDKTLTSTLPLSACA
jgi:hypothetical protein